MNEILSINNIHGYMDKENGTAYLNAEDVARGFGFTRGKNGVEYVMWDRVNRYLAEFGFSALDGSVELTRTTLCTGKGQQYFINKFLNGNPTVTERWERE